MPNRWIEHIKKYAAENKVSYACALSDPNIKNTYTKNEKTQTKATETNKKLTLKENPENTFKKTLSNRLRENMNFNIGDTFFCWFGAYKYICVITRQTEKTIFYGRCIIVKSKRFYKNGPDAIKYVDDSTLYLESYAPLMNPEKKEFKMLKSKFNIDNYIDIKNKVFLNIDRNRHLIEIKGVNADTLDELTHEKFIKIINKKNFPIHLID